MSHALGWIILHGLVYLILMTLSYSTIFIPILKMRKLSAREKKQPAQLVKGTIRTGLQEAWFHEATIKFILYSEVLFN